MYVYKGAQFHSSFGRCKLNHNVVHLDTHKNAKKKRVREKKTKTLQIIPSDGENVDHLELLCCDEESVK